MIIIELFDMGPSDRIRRGNENVYNKDNDSYILSTHHILM